MIVADPELCREVGVRQFKSIPNRSLPSPIAGSPLHQQGLFFTKYGNARTFPFSPLSAMPLLFE